MTYAQEVLLPLPLCFTCKDSYITAEGEPEKGFYLIIDKYCSSKCFDKSCSVDFLIGSSATTMISP